MQGISLKKQAMSSAYPNLLNDTEICSLSLFISTEDETWIFWDGPNSLQAPYQAQWPVPGTRHDT
jgi:hypothetical protein